MLADQLVETLLASETVANAIEVVRVSGRAPAQVADLLVAYATSAAEHSPAAAAAAGFLGQSDFGVGDPAWVDEPGPPACSDEQVATPG